MAIKHYGLDSAEIEKLRAAGLDDDEINAVNEKRVKAQVESTSEKHSEFEHIPPTAKEADEIVEQVGKIIDTAPLEDAEALSDWISHFYNLAMSRHELASGVAYVRKSPPRNAQEAKVWFNS